MPPLDGALARGLARGEAAADREVRGWVRRFLGRFAPAISAEARRDLEQEVMIELWEVVRRPAFDRERELGGFVRVLVARRAIDWLRARRAEGELPAALADPGGGPLSGLLAAERRQLARQGFEQLGAGCRELIRLQAVDGLGYREIARRLGRSEGALRVQMHRCISRLRDLLAATPPAARRREEAS
jgi:RNA polymerase sigma-70 factor (ECF subfamily)